MKTNIMLFLALCVLAFMSSCTSTEKQHNAPHQARITTKPVTVRRAIPIETVPEAAFVKSTTPPVTMEPTKQTESKVTDKVELTQSVAIQPVTPEIIKSLPPLPQSAIQKLKEFENYHLATGIKKVSDGTDGEVGYGVVHNEVEDAIREGILPPGSKLPSSMTKEEADAWLRGVTIPAYRSIVREVVTVPLTLNQEAALVFFCQNQGRDNLIKLVDQPGRLNDGNYASVVNIMPLYYKDKGGMAGLPKRGNFQVNLFQEPVRAPNNTVAMQ